MCRSQKEPIKFICADTMGLFGSIFCDFGPNFIVYDKDGEEPLSSIITHISKVKFINLFINLYI